jgi:hypothetical protein
MSPKRPFFLHHEGSETDELVLGVSYSGRHVLKAQKARTLLATLCILDPEF